MVEQNTITREISDRLEIQEILVKYCTAIDNKHYDTLDSVFSEDAILDYTSAGGIRGTLSEAKEWLSNVLSLFEITQHIAGNFIIEIEGDQATSRCSFYNPMGLKPSSPDEPVTMLFFGGYYNDKLLRTDNGWRITERVEESTWSYGLTNQPGK